MGAAFNFKMTTGPKTKAEAIEAGQDAIQQALYDHGHAGKPMPTDGGNADETLAAHAAAGIDVDALAAQLQSDAATSFVKAWNDLMSIIDKQSAALTA